MIDGRPPTAHLTKAPPASPFLPQARLPRRMHHDQPVFFLPPRVSSVFLVFSPVELLWADQVE